MLNRLTDERAELGAELARAARQARANFGNQAVGHLTQTLEVVQRTAQHLGVSVGAMPQALLDAHSVSIGEGAIALHSDTGIPLRSLGTGSSRLLVAGLQRAAASAAPIALVDEVEYGLEPHRLMRFLDSLGAKDAAAPLQVFMTTHSRSRCANCPAASYSLFGLGLNATALWRQGRPTKYKVPFGRTQRHSSPNPLSFARVPARLASRVALTNGGAALALPHSWLMVALMWTPAGKSR